MADMRRRHAGSCDKGVDSTAICVCGLEDQIRQEIAEMFTDKVNIVGNADILENNKLYRSWRDAAGCIHDVVDEGPCSCGAWHKMPHRDINPRRSIGCLCADWRTCSCGAWTVVSPCSLCSAAHRVGEPCMERGEPERVHFRGDTMDTESMQVFTLPKPEKWRCTHGHKWESLFGHNILKITLPEFGIDETFCLQCVYEWAREHFGKVRKDT